LKAWAIFGFPFGIWPGLGPCAVPIGKHCELDFDLPDFDNDCVARVVIEHLTKVFERLGSGGVRALKDVNLTVEDKELMVLVGPSGCGKTTLLRLVSGLDDATDGSISIGGESMKNVPPGERDIAMVFQNYALYPHMSAYENLAFGLRVRKMQGGEIAKRVKEAAEMLGLADCLERRPKELSGGQRQRVALGRAIVRRQTEVRIFGEPMRLRAEVDSIGELSGHADQRELLQWMEPVVPTLKKVFLVHGEPAAQQTLKVQRECAWLSLLILREQILIYSSVCHGDIRRAK